MELTIADNDDEITIASFERWLKSSRPKSKFVYHRGYLAGDREEIRLLPAQGAFVHIYFEPAHELGLIAWHAYEQGVVELVQKKLPENRGYEYTAFKRSVKRR